MDEAEKLIARAEQLRPLESIDDACEIIRLVKQAIQLNGEDYTDGDVVDTIYAITTQFARKVI